MGSEGSVAQWPGPGRWPGVSRTGRRPGRGCSRSDGRRCVRGGDAGRAGRRLCTSKGTEKEGRRTLVRSLGDGEKQSASHRNEEWGEGLQGGQVGFAPASHASLASYLHPEGLWPQQWA